MYSFLYDESETWAVWPNDVSLSEFNGSSSNFVISQIFRELLDSVKEITNDLKHNILYDKTLLTNKVNKLLTEFESYQATVQTNEVFARYLYTTLFTQSVATKQEKNK